MNAFKVKSALKFIWGVDGDKVVVLSRRNSTFPLKINDEEVYGRVKGTTEMWIGGGYTVMRSWSSGIHLEKEDFDELPIWVVLSEFPLAIFSAIGSRLGVPLEMDGLTAQGLLTEAARLKVTMKGSSDIPSMMGFTMVDEIGVETDITVDVLYRFPPPRCVNCWRFGHIKTDCEMDRRSSEEILEPVGTVREGEDDGSEEAGLNEVDKHMGLVKKMGEVLGRATQ
ncbi:hypothetical protein ZOSMA_22G01140 [Zostera marina]|uniref:Uncharacterized protein n=1 Tax=Zostera marina TaxID=29655 RepID=A0A0K9PIC4_ZOSMR|nr:hypothetical protein ZOSMA_22G01140 [Zostera marina]